MDPNQLQVRLSNPNLTLIDEIYYDKTTLEDETVHDYITSFNKPKESKQQYFLEIDPTHPEELTGVTFTLLKSPAKTTT